MASSNGLHQPVAFVIGPCPSGRPKARPDVGAARTASLTNETAFDVGKPHRVRPRRGVELDMMAAFVVGATDQDARRAGGAHLAEGDLLLAYHLNF